MLQNKIILSSIVEQIENNGGSIFIYIFLET
jgi:hypothetical protein